MPTSVENNKRASAPVVAELNQAGFPVSWISDLYARKMNYAEAIPILIKWLPLIDNTDVKESIVRALSVSWARPSAALPLIREYAKADPASTNFKWAVANALAVVADDSVFREIVDLVRDDRHGKAREMLALALGNMKNPQASEVLLDLLEDEVVAGHAIMALGKLRDRRASPRIQPFLQHPKAWVRKEASKALKKIGMQDG